MRINPESPALSLLLAMLLAMASLSIDTTLPALPLLRAEFSASTGEVQLTLTAFFLGVAAAQIFCGPLADRFGRKPVLMWGIALLVGSSIGSAQAQSIASLAGWRFFMGLTCVVGPVLARAIVRDLRAGDQAARLMARIMAIFSVAPIGGPLLGGALVATSGWRATYVAIAVIALALAALVAAYLPETAPGPRRALSVWKFVLSFGELLRQRSYRAPLLIVCASQAGIFAFVTNSSFVAVEVLGLTPWEFSALFAFAMLGHILGAHAGSQLVVRRGIRSMLRAGAVLSLAGGGLLAVLAWAGVQSAAAIALPMLVYLAGAGLVIPSASAAALTPFPALAGSASSLQLFVQTLFGAALGVVIAAASDGTTRPMAGAIGICALALFAFERWFSASGALAPGRHGAA